MQCHAVEVFLSIWVREAAGAWRKDEQTKEIHVIKTH